MPITDYNKVADRREKAVFEDPSISPQNKAYLRRFLTIYDVSPARREIFFSNIKHLLRIAPDIKKTANDRDTIPLAFHQLRSKYSPATFTTILKVSLRFARWLNNGKKPLGFKDIKTPPRSKSLRNLRPDDMTTWEEGCKFSGRSASIQLQAIYLTQLDGGFRPSEFVDLNFGNIKVENDLAIANIEDGKTGGRSVILHRAAPYLLRWLEIHPTKNPTDPLWLREGFGNTVKAGSNGRIERYGYDAINRRLQKLAKSTSFFKKIDFYSLRHSSCVLDKLDNLPVDLAAMRHGHSVDHFTRTYGRLSTRDLMTRFSKHYGLSSDTAEQVENWRCPSCQSLNPPREQQCFGCGNGKDVVADIANPGEKLHRDFVQTKSELMLARIQNGQQREQNEKKLARFEAAVLEVARQEIERQRTILSPEAFSEALASAPAQLPRTEFLH